MNKCGKCGKNLYNAFKEHEGKFYHELCLEEVLFQDRDTAPQEIRFRCSIQKMGFNTNGKPNRKINIPANQIHLVNTKIEYDVILIPVKEE